MTRIIERLMPDTELNLQTLKHYVSQMERSDTEDQTGYQIPGSDVVLSNQSLPSPLEQTVAIGTTPNTCNETTSISKEIGSVHAQVGKLRVDSKGVERKSCRVY